MALKSTIEPLVARASRHVPSQRAHSNFHHEYYSRSFLYLGLNISMLQILNWKIKDPLWPSIVHLRMGVCKPKVWFSWIDLLFHPAVGIKQARW